MKRILILVFTDIRHDARVTRQIDFLKEGYELTVCCLDCHPAQDFRVIKLPPSGLNFAKRVIIALLLIMRRFAWAHSMLYPYRSYLKKILQGNRFDAIIANDIETLPLAFQLADKHARIVFDAHEYSPRQHEDMFMWRTLFQPLNSFFCKKYIPQVSSMMTVSSGIADEYEKNYGMKPVVVTNATQFYEHGAKVNEGETIKLVHHGSVNRSRKIELIIGIMKYLEGPYSLDLILLVPENASVETKRYFQELKSLADADSRIELKSPVGINEVVPALREYDLGVIFLPQINFNHIHSLPNKFFEFVQARLGIVTGPSPEVGKSVNELKIGVVAREFSSRSYADAIRSLTREAINEFKSQAEDVARDLSAEANRKLVRKILTDILK